jgi:glycosyltransferase involved in cell wall biosynthesis
MSPDKGAHRAIAVAMQTGLPLKIAGKMREPPEVSYFEQYVRPHLVDGIEFLGEVTHGEKVELLQNARATLFPIEWEEPFGLVMIESMACGTPVLATRRGAVPEVVEDGVTGFLVPPGDVEALRDRLAYLLAHPRVAAAMGDAARARVLERFTWEACAERCLAAYAAAPAARRSAQPVLSRAPRRAS